MQEELNTTVKKASKAAKNIASKAENLDTDAMGGTARQAINRVTEGVNGITDTASDYLSSFNASPLSFVRQYPIQAAIGGVVLGFVLGSAVSRKAVTE